MVQTAAIFWRRTLLHVVELLSTPGHLLSVTDIFPQRKQGCRGWLGGGGGKGLNRIEMIPSVISDPLYHRPTLIVAGEAARRNRTAMGVIASRVPTVYIWSRRTGPPPAKGPPPATIKGSLLASRRHLYWTRQSKFHCRRAAINMLTCKCWAVEDGEQWLPTPPSARTERVFTCHSNEWSLLLLPPIPFFNPFLAVSCFLSRAQSAELEIDSPSRQRKRRRGKKR